MKLFSATTVRCLVLLASLFILFCTVSVPVSAETDSDSWEVTMPVYLYGTGLTGEVGIRSRIADIDLSFGDVLENLEFGFMGAVHARKGRWAVTGDVIYTGVGASTDVIPSAVDVDQWIVGGDVSYEIAGHFDLLGGIRFVSLHTRIEFFGPLGFRLEGDESWVDPLVGFRFHAPISEKWAFLTRFDIGGFGAGSDLSWQFHAHALWWFSNPAGFSFGYRVMDFDYENEDNGFVYNVTLSGPMAGLLLRF